MILEIRKIDTMIYFGFIYLGIFIDNIVGNQMMTSGLESNISKIYRLIFFVFLIFIMLNKFYKQNATYFLTLIGAMLVPVFQAINKFSLEGILTNELYIMKLIFPIYLILVGCILEKSGSMNKRDVEKCLNIMSWLFPISIIIPYIFHLGFKAYGDSGYSGFYSAGNELSIVLGVMFIISFNRMVKKVSMANIINVVLSALTTILTGTKTGCLVIILSIVYFAFRQKSGIRKIIFCLGMVIFALAFYIILQNVLVKEMSSNISRLLFKFNQLNGNVIDFMFSRRNRKIIPNLLQISKSGWALLFGWGYYRHFNFHNMDDWIGVGLIEMDFFDMFCSYGFIVTFLVYKFYIGNLIKNRNCKNKSYCFAIICTLLYSTLAGHTLFSALPGTVLALLYLEIIFDSNERIVDKCRKFYF